MVVTGNVNKNDPNDARSVAIAALRAKDLRPVVAEDHGAVLKLCPSAAGTSAARASRSPVVCPPRFATWADAKRPHEPSEDGHLWPG